MKVRRDYKSGGAKCDYPLAIAGVVAEVAKQMAELAIDKISMTLNRGDILLWHPFLIHGAFNCKDETLSRKSFTSHFYARKFQAKDTESGKVLSMYNHERPRPTENPRIYSAYRLNDYVYNMIVYGLYLKDKMNSVKSRLSMRREDYN